MSRARRGGEFEQLHERGDASTLAVVLLEDGTFDRVDQWTPVDEVIAEEDLEISPETEHLMLISRQDYDIMLSCVEYAERHRGSTLIPIDEAKHQRVDPGTIVLTEAELRAIVNKGKVNTFNALMRYTWGNASNLWAAMRNLLAITHKIAPQFVKGMSGTQIGALLGVCRAAFNKTEIKLVVEYLESWGVVGGTAGGSKPASHRQTKRVQMLGRKHRAAGYVRTTTPTEPPPLTREQRERAERMRQEAERRRVAALAGIDPNDPDFDLGKTQLNPGPLARSA